MEGRLTDGCIQQKSKTRVYKEYSARVALVRVGIDINTSINIIPSQQVPLHSVLLQIVRLRASASEVYVLG